jgi:hypothetical protein
MDKELVQQYKLALVEKNAPMSVQVIDGQRLSLGLITKQTKPLDVTIGSHTNLKLFSMSFHLQEILSSLDCLGLFYIIHECISM